VRIVIVVLLAGPFFLLCRRQSTLLALRPEVDD
jgi:hypothetical protein